MAALGGVIQVPTLEGPADLKIPKGTQPGQIFQFKGKGIPSLHGAGKGDQYIRAMVEIPGKLSRKQRDLLEDFQRQERSSAYKAVRDFDRKMKKFGSS